MDLSERIARIDSQLIVTDRECRLSRSDAVQVGKGYWLPNGEWGRMHVEDRQLARVVAAHQTAAIAPVFSHASAAVLLGLPLTHLREHRVNVTTYHGGTNRSSRWVLRHQGSFKEGDLVDLEGFRRTSDDRTLLDLARYAAPETALACADAYLRDAFRVERMVDGGRSVAWQAEMQNRLAEVPGERGVKRARQLLALADPRIDSPLESVSHLYLRQLGFEVALQVPLRSRKGGQYLIDFELLGLDVFGECDGKAKYLDESVRDDESAGQAFYREKRRQEWIEATTRKRVIRWGWPEVRSLSAFIAMLTAFGIPIPNQRLVRETIRRG